MTTRNLFAVIVLTLATLALTAAACTSPEPTPVPTAAPPSESPAVASPAATASPTDTPTPPPTATAAPPAPTPTFTPAPTDTPLPPTDTPAPTFTPRPRPTVTPEPTPTATPRPTYTPRPTSTPKPPSPIAGLENGAWLERNRRARHNEISALPWIADGVDYSERTAAEMLIACARWYPTTFNALLHKSWLKDDVTDAETVAVESLRWLSFYGPELPTAILQKSWAADGVSRDEAAVIKYLYWMVWTENDAARSKIIETAIEVLDMPFLESVELADAPAVRSLARLGRAGESDFLSIMAHPTISDGITDEEAKIVALLGGTYSYRPESADVLLRGAGVYLEERVVGLPLSGEVLLAIIRIRDQITPSMDYLKHSVRTIEEFMGEPLPTNYIALFFDDAVFPGSGGTNFSTHMAMQLLYDVEDGYWWDYTPHTIAHEVAHYYWGGSNQDWVDEGAAELLGSISEYARIAAPVAATNNPCASVETIAELEALNPEDLGIKGFNCNYFLGEAIFLDLYHTLGEDAFRQGFRNLYLKSQVDDADDDCEGTDLGICHLVAAFKAVAIEGEAARVDEVVARWYGPLP